MKLVRRWYIKKYKLDTLVRALILSEDEGDVGKYIGNISFKFDNTSLRDQAYILTKLAFDSLNVHIIP